MSKILSLTALIMAMSLSGAVSAATFTWLGTSPASDQWSDANNWDVGSVLPTNGGTGDTVFVRAVTPPARDPNVAVVGALYQQLYVEQDGVLNITAGTNGDWGLLGSGSSYNNVNDGTANVWGSWNMAQNLYVAHTSTAGSVATVNIYPTGTIRTQGVLTVAGRQGDGVMNIYGTYILLNNIRWDYLTVDRTYVDYVALYPGALWQWSGDRTATGTNEVQPAVDHAHHHIRSGVVGFEVKSAYDSNTAMTNIWVTRYTRSYLPAYTPALLNDGINVNRVPLYAASGTIDLAWTNPEPSDPCDPAHAITSTVYFGTTSTLTAADVLPGATDITGTSIAGVAINKLQTYYWRVDSTDPNDKDHAPVTTTGDVWTFNTLNIAPIANGGTTPVRTWLVGGAASVTITPTATDDGTFGLPGGATLSYIWSQTDATRDMLPTDVTSDTLTLNFTAVQTAGKNFTVACNDSDVTGPTYAVQVRVFATACLGGIDANGGSTEAGDLNRDCYVNYKDLATYIAAWMSCKTTDLVCPL